MKKNNATKVIQYRRMHSDPEGHTHPMVVSKVLIKGRVIANRYHCTKCSHVQEMKPLPKQERV